MSLMYVKWGNLQFQAADPIIGITKTALRGATGVRIGYIEQWTLTGELIANTQAELTEKIREIDDASKTDFKSLTLYTGDNTPSAHVLDNNKSSSGVQVVSLLWPEGPGEYVISRKYQLVVRAEFITGSPGIVGYSEVITLRGGGPKWILKNALRGRGQKQILNEQTPFFATQVGSCINYLGWLPPTPPMWPQYQHQDQSQISYKTPTFQNNVLVNYETTWNYVFESYDLIDGKPKLTRS